jgi:hypothetical protein
MLKLVPNLDLIVLLSYCGEAKVLKPASLKEKFAATIEKGRNL